MQTEGIEVSADGICGLLGYDDGDELQIIKQITLISTHQLLIRTSYK
jgi:hypothetical protein